MMISGHLSYKSFFFGHLSFFSLEKSGIIVV